MPEIAFAVHQTDADKRQTQIAGRFEMVASKDAEAAGVDRDAFMDAELGREIRDTAVPTVGIGLVIPSRGTHVAIEAFLDAIHVRQESVVVQQLLQPGLVDGAEELDRAVIELLEQVGVDPREQGHGLVVPATP